MVGDVFPANNSDKFTTHPSSKRERNLRLGNNKTEDEGKGSRQKNAMKIKIKKKKIKWPIIRIW